MRINSKPVLRRPSEPAALIRWDEKAGLLTGCDTLPMFDVLVAQRKGDRQCRRLALCRLVKARISKQVSSPSVWIWEIAGRSIAFWTKQAKSFWSRNYQRHRKRRSRSFRRYLGVASPWRQGRIRPG